VWDVDSADYADSPLAYHTELDTTLRERVVGAARGAWHAAVAHGYLRVDIRCDPQGIPLVLDVNPNPELGPRAGVCRGVQEAGWASEDFVRRQVEWARDR
jgi:D-alanine-D-alanine ligase